MTEPNKVDIDLSQSDFPSKSRLITKDEFLSQTSLSSERFDELLEMGWLKATQKTEESLMFTSSDVYKVRKLERICADFEIQALPAAIIVDLLDRVETLESEIQELKSKIR